MILVLRGATNFYYQKKASSKKQIGEKRQAGFAKLFSSQGVGTFNKQYCVFFKGLVAGATLFIYFVFFNTCILNHIHTIQSFIHLHSPRPLSISPFPHCTCSGEKPPWGAEPSFELGPASALPTELRCTLFYLDVWFSPTWVRRCLSKEDFQLSDEDCKITD